MLEESVSDREEVSSDGEVVILDVCQFFVRLRLVGCKSSVDDSFEGVGCFAHGRDNDDERCLLVTDDVQDIEDAWCIADRGSSELVYFEVFHCIVGAIVTLCRHFGGSPF